MVSKTIIETDDILTAPSQPGSLGSQVVDGNVGVVGVFSSVFTVVDGVVFSEVPDSTYICQCITFTLLLLNINI